MNFYEQAVKKIVIEGLLFLSKKELKGLHLKFNKSSVPLSDMEVADVQSLQLYFKVSQEQGDYSPGNHFSYCSIKKRHFKDFLHGPDNNINRLDTDEDPRPSAGSSILPAHEIQKSSSSSTIPSSEHSLNTIAEEESSSSSFETLNSIFRNVMNSNDDSPCSSRTSSGEGGAPESPEIDSERNKSTFLEPLMSEETFYDNLNMISTTFTTPIADSRKSYDFEVDYSFRHQLFEEEQNNVSIASSDDVGRSLAVEPNSNRHHHQAYDISPNLPIVNDNIHNYSPESEVPSSSKAISCAQLQDLQDPHALHFEFHSFSFEHEQLPNIELDLE